MHNNILTVAQKYRNSSNTFLQSQQFHQSVFYPHKNELLRNSPIDEVCMDKHIEKLTWLEVTTNICDNAHAMR